ncbi:MAG: hypothetical protein ABEK59_10905 [Halobacteria archaeon]
MRTKLIVLAVVAVVAVAGCMSGGGTENQTPEMNGTDGDSGSGGDTGAVNESGDNGTEGESGSEQTAESDSKSEPQVKENQTVQTEGTDGSMVSAINDLKNVSEDQIVKQRTTVLNTGKTGASVSVKPDQVGQLYYKFQTKGDRRVNLYLSDRPNLIKFKEGKEFQSFSPGTFKNATNGSANISVGAGTGYFVILQAADNKTDEPARLEFSYVLYRD